MKYAFKNCHITGREGNEFNYHIVNSHDGIYQYLKKKKIK